MNRMQGFSMIELMVVLAIVAILSGIAYPMYQESVRKTNRADAMEIIGDTAGRLERCFTAYGAYNSANCPIANGDVIKSTRKHYEVNVTSNASTYSLTATPITTMQTADTKCASFTLTNAGVKSSTPSGNKCW